MTHRNLTCAELDDRLGDYLEGTLDAPAVADIEVHLSGCAACAALVHDFERLASEAAALPGLAPSRDLWPSIAARLDAPVIDLASRASARATTLRATRAWRALRTGALAAGLVGISAIATYTISRASTRSTSLATNARTQSSPSAPVVETPLVVEREAADVPAERPPAVSLPGAMAVNAPPGSGSRETLGAEISSLYGVLDQRREELDPRTVAILETSIATIDSAIAEARRALRADPRSGFLSSQLDRAMEKKLGLLRTAALLPART